eukprot:CAMPEP_0113330260 /NCGR_PEP_ID=MMETSP0010_2-20120614/21488_1 /TAXON_ID=216773 ORGANISM="Corethron hystrix, Strain 308" /NCGR_SAMPLE_ID=MMETSP0010_2 /ASSEMBLY_ACC=CAM_ASM_000155 /LENGTH=79 /DNA_ID=CAMNT_0000192703 /DNA_START=190 /DNA_END=425 /DNA_ORIENTATION=+ /assembly_acc=CAM_ASM_000155
MPPLQLPLKLAPQPPQRRRVAVPPSSTYFFTRARQTRSHLLRVLHPDRDALSQHRIHGLVRVSDEAQWWKDTVPAAIPV